MLIDEMVHVSTCWPIVSFVGLNRAVKSGHLEFTPALRRETCGRIRLRVTVNAQSVDCPGAHVV